VGLSDILFRKSCAPESISSGGYLAQPPGHNTVVHPGTYRFNNRQVDVLGFLDNGRMYATLFPCCGGSGSCSEWGTFVFSRISHEKNQETWEAMVGKSGIATRVTKHRGEVALKIEVDG
jgi:hypothetical protein